jgi:hypothetical protein
LFHLISRWQVIWKKYIILIFRKSVIIYIAERRCDISTELFILRLVLYTHLNLANKVQTVPSYYYPFFLCQVISFTRISVLTIPFTAIEVKLRAVFKRFELCVSKHTNKQHIWTAKSLKVILHLKSNRILSDWSKS